MKTDLTQQLAALREQARFVFAAAEPETPTVVNDVIEWFAASIKVLTEQQADADFVYDPNCKMCSGLGYYVAGHSGREDDGNAPIHEQCDCWIPVEQELRRLLQAHHDQNTQYSRSKSAANAAMGEFKESSLSALIESGYLESKLGKQTVAMLAVAPSPDGKAEQAEAPSDIDSMSLDDAHPEWRDMLADHQEQLRKANQQFVDVSVALMRYVPESEAAAKSALQQLGDAHGYGWCQSALGKLWDEKYGCAPRGSMGVTVKDCATQPTASNAGEPMTRNEISGLIDKHALFGLRLESMVAFVRDVEAEHGVRAALASKPPAGEQKRCGYCDGTGDVHSVDGQWRGRCTCPAGQQPTLTQSKPSQDDLRDKLQRQCTTWGAYWRASDAHGVELTKDQAVELLRDALNVEVEIKDKQ